jgi:hypothetical protein
LDWFIRRRPCGLIAASIQYGHAFTRMLQGYAGTFESGFPGEYAFEDWLFRVEGLAEDEQALSPASPRRSQGRRPSPQADAHAINPPSRPSVRTTSIILIVVTTMIGHSVKD